MLASRNGCISTFLHWGHMAAAVKSSTVKPLSRIRRDRCAADVVLPRCVLASRRRGIHGGDTSFRSHTHNGLRHAICFGRIRVARRGADCTSQFVLSAVAKLAGIHPRRRMTPATVMNCGDMTAARQFRESRGPFLVGHLPRHSSSPR